MRIAQDGPPNPENDAGEITLVADQSDLLILDVQSAGRSVLVVTNSYSPYWNAYVDGVETAVFPTYHTFWGIEVDLGDHRVEWRYEPPYMRANFLNLNRFWSMDWIKALLA